MKIEEAVKILDPDTTADALYGLPYDEAMELVEDACRLAVAALREKMGEYKPLTLEELRKMEGKPVWIQSPGIPEYGRWAIVEGVSENGTALYLIHDFTCHEYGRAWLAYRREPEGAQE